MKRTAQTTVIIPTLNEEKNIGLLIKRIKRLQSDIKIIVTDDGSTDNTQAVARSNGAEIVNRSKEKVKGITAAVTDALKKVTTPFVVVMDADFQHPPEKIREIVDALKTNDIVIAARRKTIGHWSMFRKAESQIATMLARIRLGKKIDDPLSGFFGMRKEIRTATKNENVEPRCFKILFSILKNIDVRKTKIGYVYYEFDMRKRGESKIGMKHVWYFLRNVTK